jgi:hypothetical protein
MLNILQQFYIISKSNDYTIFIVKFFDNMLSKFANKSGQESLIFSNKENFKRSLLTTQGVFCQKMG